MNIKNLDFNFLLLFIKLIELLIIVNIISALIITNLEEEIKELVIILISALDFTSFNIITINPFVLDLIISDSLIFNIILFIILESFILLVIKHSRLKYN